MSDEPRATAAIAATAGDTSAGVDPDPADPALPTAAQENIETLNDYQEREEAEVSSLQAAIEALSRMFGSPRYLVFAVVFMIGWVSINLWGWHAGWRHVDEPPFFWLQGIVSANALMVTVAVLIRQNRMSSAAARRAHLDLHVNLLTERKISKALELIDQLLKQHAPDVVRDPGTQELSRPADPEAILSALEDSALPSAGHPH